MSEEVLQTDLAGVASQVMRIDGRVVSLEVWNAAVRERERVMLKYARTGVGLLTTISAGVAGNLLINYLTAHWK